MIGLLISIVYVVGIFIALAIFAAWGAQDTKPLSQETDVTDINMIGLCCVAWPILLVGIIIFGVPCAAVIFVSRPIVAGVKRYILFIERLARKEPK